ncbi:hypothetical protein T439DRAFT_356696 [Meredithblackwellia eburnea MCA 4105]
MSDWASFKSQADPSQIPPATRLGASDSKNHGNAPPPVSTLVLTRPLGPSRSLSARSKELAEGAFIEDQHHSSIVEDQKRVALVVEAFAAGRSSSEEGDGRQLRKVGLGFEEYISPKRPSLFARRTSPSFQNSSRSIGMKELVLGSVQVAIGRATKNEDLRLSGELKRRGSKMARSREGAQSVRVPVE